MVLNGKKLVIIFIVLSILAIVLRITLVGNMNTEFGVSGTIGLIHVNGTISEQRSVLSSRSTGSYLDLFRAAKKDDQIRALVIRVNSPGGSAAASQELYHLVKSISESGIPVVVSMGDIAASGAYYLASAADYVFANGSTMTGSIGVIMEFTNYQELYEKIGINVEVLTAGDLKDAGHPTKPLSEFEHEVFSELLHDSWDQFVSDIAAGRNLPREKVEELADGRIFTGRQALEHGLVDELGGIDNAIEKAKELANIRGKAKIKNYQQQSNLSLLEMLLFSIIDIPSLTPEQSIRLVY